MEVVILNHSDLQESREQNPQFPLYIYPNISVPRQREVLYTHWHNEHEIIYIHEGSATFRIGENSWVLGPGDVLIVNSREIHGAHSAGVDGLLWHAVVFDMSLLASENGDECDAEYVIPICHNQLKLASYHSVNDLNASELSHNVLEIINLFEVQPPGFRLKIKGLLFNILYTMALNGSIQLNTMDEFQFREERLMQEVMCYIGEHIDSSISLEELASITRMSKYHFCRWFKKYTEMRLVQYINSTRIHRAASLLKAGEKISEAAYQVGIDDLTYFSRVFKKYMQVSPTTYRRQFGLRQ